MDDHAPGSIADVKEAMNNVGYVPMIRVPAGPHQAWMASQVLVVLEDRGLVASVMTDVQCQVREESSRPLY